MENILQRRVELVTPEALSPYIGVDYDIVWDVVVNHVPMLQKEAEHIIHKERLLERP